MKRRLENPSGPAAPTCWQREAPAACLRVEIPNGEVHLFPFGQLVTASLITTGQAETVRITFAAHEVEVIGRNLRDLLFALQDFAVKWIRATPQRYQSLVDGEGSIVSKITVKAVE